MAARKQKKPEPRVTITRAYLDLLEHKESMLDDILRLNLGDRPLVACQLTSNRVKGKNKVSINSDDDILLFPVELSTFEEYEGLPDVDRNEIDEEDE